MIDFKSRMAAKNAAKVKAAAPVAIGSPAHEAIKKEIPFVPPTADEQIAGATARIQEIRTTLDAMDSTEFASEMAESLKEESESLFEIIEQLVPAEELPVVIAALKCEASSDDTPAPTGLGTNVLAGSSTPVNCVPNAKPEPIASSTEGFDWDAKVECTVGDLLDMHRMLSYCLRGNQRPAVLKVQQRLKLLMPEGTAIQYREP